MKKYVCKICGYIEESDVLSEKYICPLCGASKDDFNMIEDNVSDLEIDAVIDSLVEEALDEKTEKIVNNIEEDKKVRISENNPPVTLEAIFSLVGNLLAFIACLLIIKQIKYLANLNII